MWVIWVTATTILRLRLQRRCGGLGPLRGVCGTVPACDHTFQHVIRSTGVKMNIFSIFVVVVRIICICHSYTAEAFRSSGPSWERRAWVAASSRGVTLSILPGWTRLFMGIIV